jgi:hypothetical protein
MLAAISAARTAARSAALRGSFAGKPASPLVAVTQTTRRPAWTARAISAAVNHVSSSGWAQTPRMVPKLSPDRSVIAPLSPTQTVSAAGPGHRHR